MRPFPILLLCLSLLLLTACGGDPPPPTAAPTLPPPPTETPAPVEVESSGAALPTVPPELAPAIVDSLPGTLAVRDNAGTPDAPAAAAITFTLISFYQQGGMTREALSITVFGDGRLVRNGQEEGRIDSRQFDALNAALNALDFINITGSFQSGAPISGDRFQYSLSVEARDGRSRTLNTEDGLTPPELLALYDLIRSLRAVN